MVEINNRTKAKINLKLIKTVTENFLEKYKIKNKEISIALVGDNAIRELNKVYRKIDKVTDVLSFSGEDNFLGEIIIDYSQIKRQAPEFDRKVDDELVFILVHGLLHLIGYDDKTEKRRLEMIRLGDKFIKNLCHAELVSASGFKVKRP
jgi:probable rRNA maturation factor